MGAVKTTEGWVPNEVTQRIFSRVQFDEFVIGIDWEDAVRRFDGPEIPYYVRSSIHGIEGGYSIPGSAASWDPVVTQIFAQYGVTEEEIRGSLCSRVGAGHDRILDLACGTAESTRAWRRTFPAAHITAVDVSPYMIAVAERKMAQDPNVAVRCLNGEDLPFPDGSFDLVTAMLLFHELPREISPVVLAEMRRVCAWGGEIAVLEPYQVGGELLSPIPFPEPYLKDYLETDWDAAFEKAGFTDVRSTAYGEGWIRVARAA